jgi:hypothetical protein
LKASWCDTNLCRQAKPFEARIFSIWKRAQNQFLRSTLQDAFVFVFVKKTSSMCNKDLQRHFCELRSGDLLPAIVTRWVCDKTAQSHLSVKINA